MNTTIIETYPVGLLGSNVYLIYEAPGGEAAIVDPGLRDVRSIQETLASKNLSLRYVINTHGHFDHVAGNSLFANSDVTFAIHPADRALLTSGGGGAEFGFRISPSPHPDRYLEDGDEIQISESVFQVIHTPGHTPGSICLYNPQGHDLLTGDTLFAAGIGRTDLPGGNPHALRQSLRRLLSLPAQTRIYPGHGAATTLTDELKTNRWLRGLNPL